MRRWITTLVGAVSLATLLAEEEPLLPEQGEGLEIEPPMLIKSRDHDGLPNVPTTPPQADLAKLEKDLARAQRNAASGDHLFKAGIIAKVEAEERVLRVVRLEAQLAETRLAVAKEKTTDEQKIGATELKQAQQAAEDATAERHRAELEAALRNLQRQQKLLALGSGRKSDVNRAEKKLADLQSGQN